MKKETFWSLIIEPEWAQASLWSREGEDLKIISTSKPSSYRSDDLIEVVDSCLSDAIANFPDDEREPSKTVFGVPSYWVKEGSIEKVHLEKIKQICSKLSLSPTGFVVIAEAVAHSVKIQEGSPLTGVVLDVSKNFVSVSVFKLGSLVGTVNVGRSANFFEDILEGLARFEMKEPLPTRFIVVGGDQNENEELTQELIKSDWTDVGERSITFLHTPQFDSFDAERRAVAISIAGASEMGTISNVEYSGKQIAEDSTSDEFSSETLPSTSDVVGTNDLSAADIGFVIDQDIDDVSNESQEPEVSEDETAVDLINKKTNKKLPKFGLPSFSFGKKKKATKDEEPENKKPEVSPVSKPQIRKLPKFAGARKKVFAGILIILLLGIVASVGAAWWYMPKAEVVIYVSPKRLEANEAITLDEDADNTSAEDLVFLATSVTTNITESKEKASTGAITVGDKASGRVTVRNGTSSPLQLDVGDSVFGPGNLEFVLTESASVSAALSPTEPGQATLDADAVDIGAEYNIAQDETMRVDGYSSSEVDAIVNQAFSGGSSREIVAVSQNDLDILESELLDELKRKGIAQLETKVTDGRFIPESVETFVVDQEYSASVGDETNRVSLSLTLEVTGISILDSTVDNLAQELLANQVPDGFTLRSEQIEADFELVDIVDEGLFDFDVTLSANLLPEVNIDEIKANIRGLYPPDAENYLNSIPGFSRAQVDLDPRFPGKLGVIPRIDENISIEIQAER